LASAFARLIFNDVFGLAAFDEAIPPKNTACATTREAVSLARRANMNVPEQFHSFCVPVPKVLIAESKQGEFHASVHRYSNYRPWSGRYDGRYCAYGSGE
jgi:hypothetical protein